MIIIAFGPVPSRRLGKSLGINNIPPKICPYSCVYCQVGKTNNLKYLRKEFYKPEDLFGDVQELVVKVKKKGENIIDCLRNLDVQYVGPTHCTGESARNIFKKEYNDYYIEVGAGKRVFLDDLE